MSYWRPIESAPKDGTDILVADDRTVYPAFYHDSGDGYPWVLFEPDPEEPINGWPEGSPTHWMPLPEPPENEGEG